MGRILRGVSRRARAGIRSLLRVPEPYSFLAAPSIERQTIRFRFLDRTLTVEAGHDTPLYETVAEVVDYDCYQLRQIAGGLRDTVLVDVGANIGVTTLCLAQFPGARVVCFEPVPRNCAQLRANLALNGIANVTVIEAAIARRNGAASFWIPSHESVGGRLGEGAAGGEGRSVEVRTLDLATALAAADGAIGLVKLDCEGGEYDIVEQMTPDLAARLPRLTFEVHDRGESRDLRALSARLRDLGYALSYRPDPFGRQSLHHLLAERRDTP